MRLSQSTRKAMQQTIQQMFDKLEMLCQTEYARIEHFQREIKISQDRLERLETEYQNCKTVLDAFKKKGY